MNLKKILDSHDSAVKYGFLMLRCLTPQFILDIQKALPEEALYKDENDPINGFGLETETHVTLFPCLSIDTRINDLVGYLPDVTSVIPKVNNVSVFECEDYNVLKADVEPDSSIVTINALLAEHFKSHSEFEFHPHMTIAYLKKDFDYKPFLNEFEMALEVAPACYDYSWPEGDEYKHCYFKTSI